MSVPRQNNICYWSACQSSEYNPRAKGRKRTWNCKVTRNILLYERLIPKLWKQRLRPSHRMPLLTATWPQSLQGASEPMQMSRQLKFTRSLSLWAPFPCVHYYDLILLERRADSDTGDSGWTHPFLTTPIAGAGAAQDPELHRLSWHRRASKRKLLCLTLLPTHLPHFFFSF